MNEEIKVGIADMKITSQRGILITYALGSCIGISFFDPHIKLAALLHIMLPSAIQMDKSQIFKFADTGIRETLRQMAVHGGDKNRYICKIAGGARMFEIVGNNSLANIGQRNIDSVREILFKEHIHLTRQEVGENYARTMLIDAGTGLVTVRTFGKADIIM